MQREHVFHYIDEHLDEHIRHVQQWVRQKSVSWDNLGMAQCAELVADSYRQLGCQEVELIQGRFYPGVWAYYDAGAALTIDEVATLGEENLRPESVVELTWRSEDVVFVEDSEIPNRAEDE